MIAPRYDYIFLGTGAAALSLVMRMIRGGLLDQKKVLLIDRQGKRENDRTWCFWEKDPGFFEPVVKHRWTSLSFLAPDADLDLQITPYQYKVIRGIDFYDYCFSAIQQCPQIERVVGEISFGADHSGHAPIWVNGIPLDTRGAVVFNSIYEPQPITPGNLSLLQHFTGWMVETEVPFFDAHRATLMDFRVSQQEGTTFAYVLPFTSHKALVEYTLFTKALLTEQQYETELRNYLEHHLRLSSYRIIEKEFGVIPMSVHRFPFQQQGWYHIGTAGGQTKGSTGYTFQYIQKQSDWIVGQLQKGRPLPDVFPEARRFRFYDAVLLKLLVAGKPEGRRIFTRLFQRNRADRVFKFLDNETRLAEELRLISSLQFFPFLKAAVSLLSGR